MDPDRIAALKRQLAQQREALLTSEPDADASAGPLELDQTCTGRLSRIDALQGQAMSQEQRRRRVVELQRIEAALRRIEENEYGYCLRCGEPIAFQRLEVDPANPLCIRCATESDSARR
jgi:DnaK suppressor protein